jgi:hypothetical protein
MRGIDNTPSAPLASYRCSPALHAILDVHILIADGQTIVQQVWARLFGPAPAGWKSVITGTTTEYNQSIQGRNAEPEEKEVGLEAAVMDDGSANGKTKFEIELDHLPPRPKNWGDAGFKEMMRTTVKKKVAREPWKVFCSVCFSNLVANVPKSIAGLAEAKNTKKKRKVVSSIDHLTVETGEDARWGGCVVMCVVCEQ